MAGKPKAVRRAMMLLQDATVIDVNGDGDGKFTLAAEDALTPEAGRYRLVLDADAAACVVALEKADGRTKLDPTARKPRATKPAKAAKKKAARSR